MLGICKKPWRITHFWYVFIQSPCATNFKLTDGAQTLKMFAKETSGTPKGLLPDTPLELSRLRGYLIWLCLYLRWATPDENYKGTRHPLNWTPAFANELERSHDWQGYSRPLSQSPRQQYNPSLP